MAQENGQLRLDFWRGAWYHIWWKRRRTNRNTDHHKTAYHMTGDREPPDANSHDEKEPAPGASS